MIMMIPPLETQIICLSVRVVRARECQVIKEGWEFPSVCELKYKFSRRCDSWPFNWFCWCEVWFRASHKDAKPFGDWPKMGDDCDSIDIVSLQTPSNEYSIGELKFWLNLLTKEIWGNAKVWLAWQAAMLAPCTALHAHSFDRQPHVFYFRTGGKGRRWSQLRLIATLL